MEPKQTFCNFYRMFLMHCHSSFLVFTQHEKCVNFLTCSIWAGFGHCLVTEPRHMSSVSITEALALESHWKHKFNHRKRLVCVINSLHSKVNH